MIDITDPSTPRFVTGFDSPWNARGIAVHGGFVYVADSEKGLQILIIE